MSELDLNDLESSLELARYDGTGLPIDRLLALLARVRELEAKPEELAPVFTIQVWLDGDDSAQEQTDNVRMRMLRLLHHMMNDRAIRDYTIRVNGQ